MLHAVGVDPDDGHDPVHKTIIDNRGYYRFNDRLDEVLVYNRALSKWEVWNVLNPGRLSFEPSYWNGNDRQGSNNCYNYTNNKATNTFAQPGPEHPPELQERRRPGGRAGA
ncbi:hypothetical protein D187_009719 [Cystobacter fuscus DSM 2262]|uniref:Uncharacterized protein n=1 Tax=Cystobacter fuscus (strain ATCC 25194 / DSM 2262 / NBRC 100088 / M29) TaxID=1242864 RepID=S9NS85_CYSF2|nr:hypothetical protein [Cystobacter fuscus]EPX54980.1 hypothetical protein D187_009719 [Cystobacter fuscus DSM 2262]